MKFPILLNYSDGGKCLPLNFPIYLSLQKIRFEFRLKAITSFKVNCRNEDFIDINMELGKM